jgi:hypothetical protein
MPDTTNTKSDLEILTQLNADFLASVRNGDVRFFEQILAEDFTASLPDLLLRDKNQFLDMMAAPRQFTELKADEVRYSDDWQRRDGKWLCVAANTFWEP